MEVKLAIVLSLFFLSSSFSLYKKNVFLYFIFGHFFCFLRPAFGHKASTKPSPWRIHWLFCLFFSLSVAFRPLWGYSVDLVNGYQFIIVCTGTKEAPTSTQPVLPVTTAPITAALVAATEIPVTSVFAISLTMPHPIPTETIWPATPTGMIDATYIWG